MIFSMEIGSLLGVLVLALLVLAVAFLMPYAIARNLMDGHAYRNQLDASLASLRISNMLGFLGIDKDEYLHTEQGVDIKQHMHKCDTCDEKVQCDEVLATEPKPTVDLGFCANIDDLKRIEDAHRSAREAKAPE